MEEDDSDLEVSVNRTTFYKTEKMIDEAMVYFYAKHCIFDETEPIDQPSYSLLNNVPNSNSYESAQWNVFDGQPDFIDANNGNFYLKGTSDAIDAGDPTYADVYDKGNPDLGAYSYYILHDTLEYDYVYLNGEALISSDLTVQEGKTLVINPGTTIKLNEDVGIFVEGTIMAKGSAVDSIRFTSSISNPTSSEYWEGIQLKTTALDSSILKYCIIENVTNAVNVYNNSEISNNTVRDVYNYGIRLNESYSRVLDNTISNSRYGIYIYHSDYAAEEPEILRNTISDCVYGIRLSYSSPAIRDNEIYDCTHGIYCYQSSPYLGGFDGYGNNYIHNNTYGVRASTASPFLGQDYCGINGGNNWISNNSSYDVYASNSSSIMAENNWWGSSPPQTSNFYISSTSDFDYIPYLTSSPSLSIMENASPEIADFDNAFGKVSGTLNDELTEEEAMANFDPSWPEIRKINFARNLVSLDFPKSAQKICKDIIAAKPDTSIAYAAFAVLWRAGKLSNDSYGSFRAYIDSLGGLESQDEIEEHAELVDEEYDRISGLGKRAPVNYEKYTHPSVAADALLSELEYRLMSAKDLSNVMAVYSIMDSKYPNEAATIEARLLLGLIDPSDFESNTKVPVTYELSHNYPNPFNSTTIFKYGLPVMSRVEIQIFNVLGQVVKRIDFDAMDPGYHKISWNGTNAGNDIVASGMYIFRFKAKALNEDRSFTRSRKMLLIK